MKRLYLVPQANKTMLAGTQHFSYKGQVYQWQASISFFLRLSTKRFNSVPVNEARLLCLLLKCHGGHWHPFQWASGCDRWPFRVYKSETCTCTSSGSRMKLSTLSVYMYLYRFPTPFCAGWIEADQRQRSEHEPGHHHTQTIQHSLDECILVAWFGQRGHTRSNW